MSLARCFLGCAMLVVLTGCAGRRVRPVETGGRSLITRAELERATEQSLYDAVKRLRPHFLRNRAAVAHGKAPNAPLMLYVDDQKMDSIEELRRLSPSDVREVRFYEPQAANTRFGQYNNAGGAVAVTLRKTD